MNATTQAATPVFVIGSSGTVTGFGILQSLRARWGASARLVALDTNPPELNAASRLADAYHRVPAVAEPAHPARMRTLFETLVAETPPSRGPLVFIPVYDSEILWAARARETGLLPAGIEVLAPGDARAVETCNDKLAAHAALMAHGLPTPDTVLLGDRRFDGAPCVVKPRLGVASTVEIVGDAEAFARARAAHDGAEFVVQPLCAPPEITIDAFYGRDDGPNRGVTRALCRERLQVKAGIATKCRLFEDAALSDLATRIAVALELRGSFCFQVMRAEAAAPEAGWRITDINPRSGGGTRMAAAVGCDFMAANAADFLGLPVADVLRLQPFAGDRFVVRQHAEYVTGPGDAG